MHGKVILNNKSGRTRTNNSMKLIGPLDASAIYTILKNQPSDLIRARMAAGNANASFVIWTMSVQAPAGLGVPKQN